jgi:hypothetical protein
MPDVRYVDLASFNFIKDKVSKPRNNDYPPVGLVNFTSFVGIAGESKGSIDKPRDHPSRRRRVVLADIGVDRLKIGLCRPREANLHASFARAIIEGGDFVIGRELATLSGLHAFSHRGPFIVAQMVNPLLVPRDNVLDGFKDLVEKLFRQGRDPLNQALALRHHGLTIITLNLLSSASSAVSYAGMNTANGSSTLRWR